MGSCPPPPSANSKLFNGHIWLGAGVGKTRCPVVQLGFWILTGWEGKGLGTLLRGTQLLICLCSRLSPTLHKSVFLRVHCFSPSPCLEPFLWECFPTSIKLSAFSLWVFWLCFFFSNMLSAPSCCPFQPPLLPTLLSSSVICPLEFPQLSLQADISLNLEMTLLIYHLYVIHTDSDVLSLFPCLSLCWLPLSHCKGRFYTGFMPLEKESKLLPWKAYCNGGMSKLA